MNTLLLLLGLALIQIPIGTAYAEPVKGFVFITGDDTE